MSRNTRIGDYKKAFTQEDALIDKLLEIINNSDIRQYLTIPEGNITRESLQLAIRESMATEVKKREKEEDKRVK